MNLRNLPEQGKTFILVLAWVLAGGIGYPTGVQAQLIELASSQQSYTKARFFPPSGSGGGRPVKRKDAGSSGSCETANITGGEFLTALVPKRDAHALTVDPYPTLWFYIPYQSFHSMEFELQDENYKTLDKMIMIPTSALPGIIRFRLPSALQEGKQYNWRLIVYCQDPQSTSGNQVEFFVEGSIKRVPKSSALESELRGAVTESEQAAIYARNGVWFEAVTLLGNLRQGSGNSADWAELLDSVGLGDIAPKPIIDCCRPSPN